MIAYSGFRRSVLFALAVGVPAIVSFMALGETAAPPNAVIYFINLKDGDTVISPFKVQFGLSGMGVAPAGVEKPNTGHHHLIIDGARRLVAYSVQSADHVAGDHGHGEMNRAQAGLDKIRDG